MPGKNGKKSNAGRPRGSQNKATLEIKTILAKNVDFNVVVQRLMELVDGVTVEEKRKGGSVVYTKSPDSFAAKILLEYGFGKPAQPISNDRDKPFNVHVTVEPVG